MGRRGAGARASLDAPRTGVAREERLAAAQLGEDASNRPGVDRHRILTLRGGAHSRPQCARRRESGRAGCARR